MTHLRHWNSVAAPLLKPLPEVQFEQLRCHLHFREHGMWHAATRFPGCSRWRGCGAAVRGERATVGQIIPGGLSRTGRRSGRAIVRQRLHDLGYSEGRNLVFDVRSAEGQLNACRNWLPSSSKSIRTSSSRASARPRPRRRRPRPEPFRSSSRGPVTRSGRASSAACADPAQILPVSIPRPVRSTASGCKCSMNSLPEPAMSRCL